MSASVAPGLTVVTGAASGIGRATAGALRQRGAQVIGVDLVEPPEELRTDEAVDWVQGDVSSPDTWDRVTALCGRGTSDGADWRRIFDVNVMGVILGMHALLPPMLERRDGAIAVVCSVNSFVVEDELSAYSTSKAALLHATRSAAVEYAAHGVRINAVCPGIIDTPLLRRHFESLDDPAGARRAAERRSPIGRILRPDEVAEAICFLLGGSATALAGAALTVDGGLTVTYDFDSVGRA